MLPVQSRHELAGEHFCAIQDRCGGFCHEPLRCAVGQGTHDRREHGAAKHHIRLDLDLRVAISHNEASLAEIGRHGGCRG